MAAEPAPTPPSDADATHSLGAEAADGDSLAGVLERYVASIEKGEAPDPEALIAQHPGLASVLRECLGAISFIHGASKSIAAAGPRPEARLGDFILIREIGAGGMGVVFEAEQVSLKRRVALKVLRYGPAADPEAMQRFEREARTVAALHHTNIVPIFAVGRENGVPYYAMQLIDGESLAEAALRRREKVPDTFLPATREIAGWGLQAAEALEHAHRRGVIHRDIKPSNILLDRDGRIWLTDFGLARRLDDVTLSLSGIVLGTPRYMSPEQARATKQPVDQRSDVYSLGATLYELIAGRPVFDAATPQAILSQIIERDPVPLRRLDRTVPRDLETIVLKCLAKEPERRYPSAAALASDLRAFVEGRSIAARRPRLVERGLRLLKRERRSVAAAGAAAALAGLFLTMAYLGVLEYREKRLARVRFAAAEPDIKAEVVREDGAVAAAAFRIPTEKPLDLPEGSYLVRASRPGFPGVLHRLDVERGSSLEFEFGFEKSRLWKPIEMSTSELHGLEILDLEGRGDVLVLTKTSLKRLHGGTRDVIWEIPLAAAPGESGGKSRKGLDAEAASFLSDTPQLAVAMEIDGDGVRDVVLGRGGLAALAGKNGSLLWRARAVGAGGGAETRLLEGAALLDVNGDGVLDIAATASSTLGASERQLFIEAFSGRDGAPLWRRRVERFAFSADEPRAIESARAATIGGKPRLVLAAGDRILVVEPASGADAWPAIDLGFRPPEPPQLADLDGDGDVEALLLRETVGAADAGLECIAFSIRERRALWAHPLQARRQKPSSEHRPWWEPPPRPAWPLLADLDGDRRLEVLVPTRHRADRSAGYALEALEGASGRRRWIRWWPDAASEAERRAGTEASASERLSAELRSSVDAQSGGSPAAAMFRVLLPGSTSAERNQIERFIDGPDADGDGQRDLFAACFEPGGRLFVTALSGKDGRTLWWREKALRRARLGPLAWWHYGPDGLPLLVVPFDNEANRGSRQTINGVEVENPPSALYSFAAGDGRDAHTLGGLAAASFADLDGDGILDLSSLASFKDHWGDYQIRFSALRGRPGAVWSRLGALGAAADFDGDGQVDAFGSGAAVSGADGRTIWRSADADGEVLAPAPLGDLDGDGAADLVHASGGSVRAFSGKTGRVLWSASAGGERSEAMSIHGVETGSSLPRPRLADLDGDRRAELLFFFNEFYELKETPGKELRQGKAAAFDGRDGARRWEAVFAPEGHTVKPSAPVAADLDGDRCLDLVLLAIAPSRTWELRALSGRDGRTLWTRTIGGAIEESFNRPPAPVLLGLDVDRDGRSELIVIDRVFEFEAPKRARRAFFRLEARRGADGEALWSWDGPETGPHALETDGSAPWGAAAAAARRADGSPSIAVALYAHGRFVDPKSRGGWRETLQRAVFGANGRPRFLGEEEEMPNRSSWPLGSETVDVLAHDIDGDGEDELLWIDSRGLTAARGETMQAVWEWRLPSGLRPRRESYASDSGSPWTKILRLIEGGGERKGAALAVRTTRGVFGLDARSGKALWRTTGDAILPGDAGGPPRCLEPVPGAVLCALGIPLDAGPVRSALAAETAKPAPDPRYARPLPWPAPGELDFYLGRSINSLLFIALPLALFAWARRARSWKLAGLGVFELASVGLACALGILPRQFDTWGGIGIAIDFYASSRVPLPNYVLGLPFVAAGALACLWTLRRQWARLGALAASSLAGAAALAAWRLHRDAPRRDALEHYDLSHWPWILLQGIYLAGAIVLAAAFALGAFRLARAAIRRRRART